jgi:hypothetical protein
MGRNLRLRLGEDDGAGVLALAGYGRVGRDDADPFV